MRIRQSEALDDVDGVRSVVVVGASTYWVDAPAEVSAAELGAVLLGTARADALALIERLAETRREVLTSTGAGKRDAYLLKYELLLRAIADPPDATAEALITAEATARGLTYDQLATLIAQKRVAWEQAAMAIETAEAVAKTAVSAAADRAAVSAAVDAARAAFAAIGG